MGSPQTTLIRLGKFAEAVGISKQKALTLAQTGQVKAFKEGGRTSPYMVEVAEIDRYKQRIAYNPAA